MFPSSSPPELPEDVFGSPDERQALLRRPTKDSRFETIDFQQQLSRGKLLRHDVIARADGCTGTLYRIYFFAQGWVVALLAACLLGIVAYLISVGAEWMTDIKFGICSEWFYLNKRLCCMEYLLETDCNRWKEWAVLFGLSFYPGKYFYSFGYFMYCLLAVMMAVSAAFFVKSLTKRYYAAGSGIPEIKTILGGAIMRKYLGVWTLVVKSFGLVLSVGSGLNLGKEGPFVHVACCIGNICSRIFRKFRNEAKRREVLSACAAAGVSVAFGAPVGGVLFTVEEASYHFKHKVLWRSFFAAVMAALVLQALNPNDSGKLVLFEVRYRHNWHWFEMPVFAFLGIVGGLVGALFCKLNIMWSRIRRSKGSFLNRYPVFEVLIVSLFTAILSYPNPYTRGSSTNLLSSLFNECDDPNSQSLDGLCDEEGVTRASLRLLAAAAVKFILVIFTFGIRVPAGLFIPSLAIGACLGRISGILMRQFYVSNPSSELFLECQGMTHCIVPGIYALVGAAAVLGGVTRMTVSLTVIMFELTGGLEYIAPTMVSILISKWVADALVSGSIYEGHIEINKYPYLDQGAIIPFGYSVSDVMTPFSIDDQRRMFVLEAHGNTASVLENFLQSHQAFVGFPVVQSIDQPYVVGYAPRRTLVECLKTFYLQLSDQSESYDVASSSSNPQIAFMGENCRASAYSNTSSSDSDSHSLADASMLDFSVALDPCPVQVLPNTPLERVHDLITSLGIRYVLVVELGKLVGILTKSDLHEVLVEMAACSARGERFTCRRRVVLGDLEHGRPREIEDISDDDTDYNSSDDDAPPGLRPRSRAVGQIPYPSSEFSMRP